MLGVPNTASDVCFVIHLKRDSLRSKEVYSRRPIGFRATVVLWF